MILLNESLIYRVRVYVYLCPDVSPLAAARLPGQDRNTASHCRLSIAAPSTFIDTASSIIQERQTFIGTRVMCAARPCLEKGGHPRLTSLLPPGPVSFPRNDWSSHNPPPWVFPPYHRADSTHTMLWAARGASEQWYNVVSALSLHGHVAPRQVSVKLLNSIVASSPILSKTKLRHIKSAESTDKLLLAPLATPLHLFGGSPIDFDVPPASTICNTIFALAVVDKVLEM